MRKLLLLPLVVVVLLVACGGDDEPDATPTTSGVSTASPTATVEAVSPTAEVVNPTPTTAPTATAEPAGTGCGQPLLSPEERAPLSGLEGRIVFVCDGQVWTANPDGTGQVRATEPVDIDWDRVRLYRVPEEEPPSVSERADLERWMNTMPRWLSDGRIIFASTRDTLALSASAPPGAPRPFVGATELYAVEADGSGLERLTEYNLTPGAYEGAYGEFAPSECASPTFCFAGLLSITPATAATSVPVAAVQVTEIRFSECCGFLGLLDLSVSPPALTAAASLLGFDHPGHVSTWHWANSDQTSLVMAWTELPSFDEFVFPEARLYEGEAFELLPETVGAGATLSPDATLVAHCDRTEANTTPSGIFVTAVGGDDLHKIGDFMQSCALDWSPEGAHVVTVVGASIVVIDAKSGDSWTVATGSDPDWGPF